MRSLFLCLSVTLSRALSILYALLFADMRAVLKRVQVLRFPLLSVRAGARVFDCGYSSVLFVVGLVVIVHG